ncbi:MAG: hypothetical protein NT157_02000 [Candidatus Micrarchaeota archaeon]|nr:hypothetical protein [Candidatus Micrarchaeota archaeon]
MKIVVVNIGGQYNHMIHRTVMDSGVDSEMVGLEINLEWNG